MKQLSSRILATVLSLTLLASAIVGALSVSVLPAKADEFPASGYLDDLFAAAFEDVPSENRVTLEYYQSLFDERFDDYLIVVIHDTVLNGWYFAAYDGTDGADPFRWCLNNGSYSPYYTTLIAKYSNNGYYTTSCNFIAGCKFQGSSWSSHGGDSMNYDKLSQFVNWNTGWQYLTPNPLYLNLSGYECYSNRDLYKWNNDDPSDSRFMLANLNPGSDVPEIIDFSYFKFNLGDRWYLTTFDQSLVLNMERGDDSFWVWVLRLLPSGDSYDLDPRVLSFAKMVFLPEAQNFISENVTNISSRGILAYDITDLILSDDYVAVWESFFTIVGDASPDPFFNPVAFSDTTVNLFLEPEDQNQSFYESWTTINNYVINYPSVTVAPQQLAEQLFGDTAYTGFMGDIRIPYSLGLHFGLFGQDVNLCDAYFHYWLYQSGLGADENSILNFDLFNACVVAAPQVNRNVFVAYWDTDDPQSIDYTYVGLMDTQDLLDTFDLLLVAPAGSKWLEEVDGSFPSFTGSSGAYTNLNQESPLTPRGVEGVYPVYIIVSHKAITKSQLYVFCDGFNKLYDLATQFCNKRDLWDSSFFDWSMSVFWELQSIDGHLNSIDFTIKSWDLGNKLSNIVDSLNRIADNTDELQEPMWYESLWNWVRQFTPSDSAFLTGLNAIDDGFDNIPLLPVPTNYPTYPLLPTFTPTPVPDPGGE